MARFEVEADDFTVRVFFNFAVIVLVVASFLSTALAFAVYDLAPPAYSRHAAWSPILNVFSPVLGGAIAYVALRALSLRLSWALRGYGHHLARTATWYFLVAAILGVVLSNLDNADWGLFGQLFTWPLWSVATALVIDFGLTVRLEHTPPGRNAAG